MGKKDFEIHSRKKTIILFVVSLFLIAGMMVAVAQNTNWLSFARNPQQMMNWCANHYPPELCKKIQALQNGGTNDPELAAWCRSKCGDYGKESKVCKSICVDANNTSCNAACNQYNNPVISKQCKARCPSLLMPTVTPTPTP